MSAPVITNLAPVAEDATWTTTPYTLEVKGQTEKRVSVTKVMDPETGRNVVRIVALAAAGVPVQPVGMMDYIARNILPGARVQAFHKADNRVTRVYATA